MLKDKTFLILFLLLIVGLSISFVSANQHDNSISDNSILNHNIADNSILKNHNSLLTLMNNSQTSHINNNYQNNAKTSLKSMESVTLHLHDGDHKLGEIHRVEVYDLYSGKCYANTYPDEEGNVYLNFGALGATKCRVNLYSEETLIDTVDLQVSWFDTDIDLNIDVPHNIIKSDDVSRYVGKQGNYTVKILDEEGKPALM